jgi:hypothetical protein
VQASIGLKSSDESMCVSKLQIMVGAIEHVDRLHE